MSVESKNIILDKSFVFALHVIELYKKLIKQNEFVLSRQLLRSATSIGANIEEALGGHSKKDFLAKMIISYKEARETKYWLRLIDKSNIIREDIEPYLKEIDEINNILTAIINTSKKNLEPSPILNS